MSAERIVHLTTVHRADDNRIFRKEVTSLHEAGLDVTLVAPAPGREGDGPKKLLLPRRSGRLSRMLLGPVDALKALRRLRPTVLHIHDPELIPLAILWSRRRGRAAVYDAHEDLPKQVMGKPYLPAWSRRLVAALASKLEGMADRHLDAIVAATPSISQNYANRRTVLVQNFPWLREYPEPASRSDGAEKVACYVGGVSYERGWRTMMSGTERAGFALDVAGPVTADVSRELPDAPHVNYLGVLPAEQVPDVIARSSLGLVLFQPLPNNVEAQPTKLFEYMASGVPFVASDFPRWRQLLERFDCGLFIDPTSPDALADVLKELARDPDRARAMGSNGRRALIEHFTFEGEATALAELYADLLAHGQKQ